MTMPCCCLRMIRAGSGKFNRALRHWANTACSAQANAAAPGANAFKLTDTALLPCLRDSKTSSREMQVGQLTGLFRVCLGFRVGRNLNAFAMVPS